MKYNITLLEIENFDIRYTKINQAMSDDTNRTILYINGVILFDYCGINAYPPLLLRLMSLLATIKVGLINNNYEI